MKGDFTRFTHRPARHYTRVLKQQGRVDLDADWNESVEILTHLERTEAVDVIGRCGVPAGSDGFRVQQTADGGNLTISQGRIYVDGILCSNEMPDGEPIPITAQEQLPNYDPELHDDVYLLYVDVWERHITALEDPEIREVALGGPDTTTRTQTICQVKLTPLGLGGPLEDVACSPFEPLPADGLLAAQAETADPASNPCVVPAEAGYRGLENRLYRVEIHDDGRDQNGHQNGLPTFKWSRDNGSVVLPIADEAGIDDEVVTLRRLGRDEVLTVRVGDWVEVLGDKTELYGLPGTLAEIEAIDRATLHVTLSRSVASHADESHLKVRRWDHQETTVPLVDGAIPIQSDWFELEDGVQVRFDTAGTYHVGDYWLIPARTRQGNVLWDRVGDAPAELARFGIEHHYCTLALALREDGAWVDVKDCRPLFWPLTEIRGGGCCLRVEPGEDVQRALDLVVGRGGGCVSLCPGVHRVAGPLWIRNANDIKLVGENDASVLRFEGLDASGNGGLIIERGQRIAVQGLFICGDDLPALVSVRHDGLLVPSRDVALRRLTLANLTRSDGPLLACGVRVGHARGIQIDECRIAADAGIVSLWGNTLPDPPMKEDDTSEDVGDGTVELTLRRSAIRFSDYGVIAGRAEKWSVTRSSLQSRDAVAWSDVLEVFPPAAGMLEDYRTVLDWLAVVFEQAPRTPATGAAIAAFLWRDCTVSNCDVLGAKGMHVFCWVRGGVTRTAVGAVDPGLFAFWLHDADWVRNRVNCTEGIALAFVGSASSRLDHNRVAALLGVSTVPFTTGLQSLGEIGIALLRLYGAEGEAGVSLAWVLVEEIVDLLRLRDVVDALARSLGTGSALLTYWLAHMLLTFMQRPREPGSALVVADLSLVGNRFDCTTGCIALQDFLPLGSLRVAGNRVRTTTGQAIRIQATSLVANPHLLNVFIRVLLTLVLRRIDDALEDADGARADYLEALRATVSGWQTGIEPYLTADFRIEANSVRSLRTAIESNLFELAIVGNHITLLERPVGRRIGTGTVFGRVSNLQGAGIAAATVRVRGTSRAAMTDASGAFRLSDVPAGTHTIEASQLGYATASAQVTVAGGETVGVNLVLSSPDNAFLTAETNTAAFSTVSLATAAPPAAGSNTEFAAVLQALERSTAFEPLAATMRDGGQSSAVTYSTHLLAPGGPLATAAARTAAAEAVSGVQAATSDPDLATTSAELATALRNNTGVTATLLPAFIKGLHRYIDSLGILVTGAGDRIVENQVLVPADIDPETEALGGIQISVNYFELAGTIAIANAILQLAGGAGDQLDTIADPLLDITETLVENNEVTGGVGHGISIQGTAGQPDFLRDLRISGNQIRGLGGGAVFSNEHAYLVGLRIDGNQLSSCGRPVGFTLAKGGVIVRAAAVCGIRGNRIAGCGAEAGGGVSGVDLDTVYNLHFVDNELLSNGADDAGAEDGGLQMVEVYGNVLVHDNLFSLNRGIGLSWINSARVEDAALLPGILLTAANEYLRTNRQSRELVEQEQASVQGNTFEGDEIDLPLLQLMNLTSVSFVGNNCSALTGGIPLGEIQMAARGAVANNVLHTNAPVAIAIKKLADGIIVGNVGQIQVQFSGANLQIGLNTPAVIQ